MSHVIDFWGTQLFFDNEFFYNFKEKLDILGIKFLFIQVLFLL